MISLEEKWEIDNNIGFKVTQKNGEEILIKNGKIEEVKKEEKK